MHVFLLFYVRFTSFRLFDVDSSVTITLGDAEFSSEVTKGQNPLGIGELFGEYQRNGYQTTFQEDICWYDSSGIMLTDLERRYVPSTPQEFEKRLAPFHLADFGLSKGLFSRESNVPCWYRNSSLSLLVAGVRSCEKCVIVMHNNNNSKISISLCNYEVKLRFIIGSKNFEMNKSQVQQA